jgi:DNA-binding transcriptional LysR family regulator
MRNLSAVDLNLLVAFDALLMERNVTRAAERIGLSQPALSKALTRLRALFKDDLFVRRGRAMEPTAKAVALGAPVRRALDEIRTTIGAPAAFDPAAARATITIGSIDFYDALLLPPLLARLEREAPGMDVQTRQFDRLTAPQMLAAGEIELGLLPMGDMVNDLYAEPLFTERSLTLMRKGHPLARRGALTIESFAHARHAKVGIEGRGVGWIDSMLAARGLQRRVVLTVPHFMTLPFVIGATDLITTLPSRLARLVGRSADIVALPPPLTSPTLTVHLAWHVRTHHSALHVWLRDVIMAVAQDL